MNEARKIKDNGSMMVLVEKKKRLAKTKMGWMPIPSNISMEMEYDLWLGFAARRKPYSDDGGGDGDGGGGGGGGGGGSRNMFEVG
ncbi:hypothetical protein M0804_003166 [Polistes exclamans]|nr:hypothetical protein M0804_003166 [Polistes exclamans]